VGESRWHSAKRGDLSMAMPIESLSQFVSEEFSLKVIRFSAEKVGHSGQSACDTKTAITIQFMITLIRNALASTSKRRETGTCLRKWDLPKSPELLSPNPRNI
jgi:hypothetical protein